MISSSVVVLLLALNHQGLADEVQPTEQPSLCQCPEELPWPGHEFDISNEQLLCGKELMYLVPNTKCDKETIYSCKVNGTVPEFQEKCRYYCIPTSIKDCTYGKELRDQCLRHRLCHDEKVMKRRMENLYGKNWHKKFN